MPSPFSNNKALFPILLVNFIGTLGFSIVLPFLVFLVTRMGGNAIVYGAIGATYSAFQLFGAPILGKWSDIYGRRKILLLSQIGTLVSWVVFLIALFIPLTELSQVKSDTLGEFTLTLPLLLVFLARAMDGATGGNISVANAYLADITDKKDRSRNFGKMSISANLGFILGPALAGVLGATAYGERLPVLAALAISLAATIVIILYLPESRQCTLHEDPEAVNVRKIFGQEHKECFDIETPEKTGLKDIVVIEGMAFVLILYFLIFLGFNLFYTAFPIHAVKGLKWTVADTGFFFSILSFMMVVAQGPVLSKASKLYSDGILAIVGSIILASNFVLLISDSKIIIYCAAVLFALGNGLMWPSILSILSKVAGDKYQGAAQGIAGSIGSLASIIGLLIGGLTYESIGENTFMISAGIIALVFLLSFQLLPIDKKLKNE